MQIETLAAALEREHHEIDAGIETFTNGLSGGQLDTASLTSAMAALRRHIYLEEEFIFPPLRAAGMFGPILVMLREHAELWATLETLDAELATGADSAAVREGCGVLLSQLASHNTKEEPIVYPQVDAVLSASSSAELREFLDSGLIPGGWICTQART